jgi:hypothetical protein
MKYAAEMVIYVMMHIPSFMKIGAGVKAILRLWPQQFEKLQYWYYFLKGFAFKQ